MCRYAAPYKPHYACFECRKTFKRRLLGDIYGGNNKDHDSLPAKCPDCGNYMVDMGLDFESPKKSDLKAWLHIKDLYKSGITFHSCGCSGPGYIPKDRVKLLEYLEDIKEKYISHRRYWSNKLELSDSEDKSLSKGDQYKYTWHLPKSIKNEKRRVVEVDVKEAVDFWVNRIHDVEFKINELK